MKIGYRVDNFLFNLYMQEKIFDVCINKFNYESRSHQIYNSLNLTDNEEHKQLYQQMKDIVSNYRHNDVYARDVDLSGKILKFFSSCVDYHCKEILETIQSHNFLYNSKEIMSDSPILWIIRELRNTITENFSYFSKGSEYIYDESLCYNIEEHILINWDRTQDYETNIDENELYETIYIDKENKVKQILLEFQKKWNIVYKKIDDYFYSIKFKNYKHFSKFKKFALQNSRPCSMFEGDVINLVYNYNESNGIIELILSEVFDIQNVLAKLLGLKADD